MFAEPYLIIYDKPTKKQHIILNNASTISTGMHRRIVSNQTQNDPAKQGRFTQSINLFSDD